MSAHTRYRLLMGSAFSSGLILVAGVAWAAAVRADDASYLNDLHNAGIRDLDGGDPALLQTGHKLCNEIWFGESPNALDAMALQSSDASQGKRGLSPQQATDVVNFAISDLCPDY